MTRGFYFRGFGQATLAALLLRLAALAAEYGYRTRRGLKAGHGNIAEFLVAIDSGDLATVLLSDEQRDAAMRFLAEESTARLDTTLGGAFEVIGQALADAVARERAAAQREIAESTE